MGKILWTSKEALGNISYFYYFLRPNQYIAGKWK